MTPTRSHTRTHLALFATALVMFDQASPPRWTIRLAVLEGLLFRKPLGGRQLVGIVIALAAEAAVQDVRSSLNVCT
jgi:hypothetical protein